MENNDTAYKELQPGTVLCGGKYTILEKIGEGGFGITYKAVQNGLNRTVCIKEFFPAGRCVRATHAKTVCAQGTSKEVYEKYRHGFVKEAKMLATLRHPNIVEVIDVFDENNTSYMVMAFIEGRTLQSIVESRGKLPYPEVVNYIAQVTNAVNYIHERHILHRDIKPDNIMITADYKAILIDFGSAREFEQDKTQMHTAMLTHGYAPTEQYTSNSRKGSYTDIYAIGATMYFALTGEVPLEAAARLTEPMPEPRDLAPDIPDEANRTILKAMQIKAENRHQTVQEFMDDLRNVKPSVLIDETIGVKKASSKKLWFILATAAVIIGALIYFLISRPKEVEVIEVEKGKPEYKTYDFTGMDKYPMIKVEGGTFEMGTPEEDDCTPHTVTLSDFYIGQYEVPQGLWSEIMGYNPSDYQPENGCDSLPVENISFDEAQQFVDRLNDITGQEFSLPTEAQWEFAARGGIKSEGNKIAGKYPNNIWFSKDHPFKIKFPPSVNELGIYQMSGNVAEWCLDTYDADFYRVSDYSYDPVNIGDIDMCHVTRGGNFSDDEIKKINVFYRETGDNASSTIGLRLVLNP